MRATPNKIFFSLLLLLTSSTAWADIYSFTAADGTVHLSNVPSDGRYTLYMRTPSENPAVSPSKPIRSNASNTENRQRYSHFVKQAAQTYNIEPALLEAVIATESGFNSNAVSPKGAVGLMQIMPDTAKRYGVSNLYDPMQNISGGAQYLSDLMQLFNNDLKLVLAAYNAGENAVIRHGNRIPPYNETIKYVPKVMGAYTKYQQM